MSKKRLFVIPQMPITLRYTSWWPQVFEAELSSFFDYEMTPLNRSYKILPIQSFGNTDGFMKAMINWEAINVAELASLPTTKDDIILCLDGCTPGLVATYLQTHRPCRTVCVCHGSSFNSHDIFPVSRQLFDRVALNTFDNVIVASHYHAHKLVMNGVDNKRIVVTGGLPVNPYYSTIKKQAYPYNGRPRVAIIDRPGDQKRSQFLLEAIKNHPDLDVVDFFSPDRKPHQSFTEYLTELSSFSHVLVTAREETYGYQIRDAVAMGVIPICPREYCYPEFVPNMFLYNRTQDLPKVVNEIVMKICVTLDMFHCQDDEQKKSLGCVDESLLLQHKNDKDFFKNLTNFLTN